MAIRIRLEWWVTFKVGHYDRDEFIDFAGRTIFGTLSIGAPQAFAPALEIYMDKSMFFNTPIEGHYMKQSLLPTERVRDRTSGFAQMVSKGINYVDPTLKQDYTPSPVQIDHLVNGYLGWVGNTASAVADGIYNSLWGEGEKMDARFRDIRVAGEIVKRTTPDLVLRATKASTGFYELLGSAQQMARTVKKLREKGDVLEAKEVMTKNRRLIAARTFGDRVSKQLTMINKRMRNIKQSKTMSGEDKRKRVDELQLRKNQLQKTAADKLRAAKLGDR